MIVEIIRFLIGLIVGAVLFIPLTLVPLVGPLFTGYTSAKIAKVGVTRAIILGFISSLAGFLAWVFYIYPQIAGSLDSTLSLVFLWLFVIWNITSMIFTIGGALISGIQTTTEKIQLAAAQTMATRTGEQGMNVECDIAETLIVCPNCGSGNKEDAKTCCFCGAQIQA